MQVIGGSCTSSTFRNMICMFNDYYNLSSNETNDMYCLCSGSKPSELIRHSGLLLEVGMCADRTRTATLVAALVKLYFECYLRFIWLADSVVPIQTPLENYWVRCLGWIWLL